MTKTEFSEALEDEKTYLLSYACNMPSGRVDFARVIAKGDVLRRFYLPREDVIPLFIIDWSGREGGAG